MYVSAQIVFDVFVSRMGRDGIRNCYNILRRIEYLGFVNSMESGRSVRIVKSLLNVSYVGNRQVCE